MKKFTKKYQVWIKVQEKDAYILHEFDELEEAVLFNKNTNDWFLSEALSYGSCSIKTLEDKEKE